MVDVYFSRCFSYIESRTNVFTTPKINLFIDLTRMAMQGLFGGQFMEFEKNPSKLTWILIYLFVIFSRE